MKGLFVKDMRLLVQQKQFFILLLVLSVVFSVNSGGTFAVGYLTFVGSFFVLSTINYDENDNGYAFLMTLPVMRKTYVRGKYVFGILLGIAAWLAGLLISAIVMMVNRQAFSISDILMESVLMLPCFGVLMAFMVPFQFKFGAEKGRVAIFIAAGFLAAGIYVIEEIIDRSGIQMKEIINSFSAVHFGLLVSVAFALSALALFISCVISCRVMVKKEF